MDTTRDEDHLAHEPSSYRHTVRIRYGEVDQQGVVFNAHYLAFIDDALENWIEGLRANESPDVASWDHMLKKVTIEWHGSVGNADRLDIDCYVSHWGRSSFEITYRGRHQGRPVFDAAVVYVSVLMGKNTSIQTPQVVRDHFGAAYPGLFPRP